MILTGKKIAAEVARKKIIIEPFCREDITPNAYNFTLGPTLHCYKNHVLDAKKENHITEMDIPPEGYVLQPDVIYLGHTVEVMGSEHYVPILRGRSSTGRLGLFIHITADLIDIGSINQYTLMLHAVQPVKVYAGMKIGQITFWVPKGKIQLYDGKYKGLKGPQASKIHLDFK